MVIQHSLSLLKELSEIESKIESWQKIIRDNELNVELDDVLLKSYLAQHHSTTD